MSKKEWFFLLILVFVFSSTAFLFHPPQKEKIHLKKNVFVLVFDGLSASYLNEAPYLGSMEYETMRVNFPSTTPSHAGMLIAGDCGAEKEYVKNCVDDPGIVSACDFVRDAGGICLMVSEAGDFREGRNEFDLAFHDKGLGDWEMEVNSPGVSELNLETFFISWKNKYREYVEEKNEVEKYALYSKYVLDLDLALLKHLEENFPGQRFLLFSNAKGIDSCGHNGNEEQYRECIAELDEDAKELADYLQRTEGLVSVFTADHGMFFPCAECRGTHSREPASLSEEVLLVPAIFFGEQPENWGEGKSFDLMPAIFSLAGAENACERMKYCKGNSLS